MKKAYIIFLSKWYCRVQIFLGLCLAMLFICSNIDTYASDFGPSGIPASPTPISSFITYGFDVLDPNGSQSDWLHHEMVHVETDRSSSNFYQTIYKSNLMYALDAYYSIYPSETYNSSLFESYIDEFMLAFDTYFPFDPHNPKFLINSFCNRYSIYFTIDLNYNSFDIDPSSYYIYSNNSDYYIATSDNFISTFVAAIRNNSTTYYISFDYQDNTHFGIQNRKNYLYLCDLNYFSYFSDLGFSSNSNPNTFRSILYGATLASNSNSPYFEGYFYNIDNSTTCPLVIFKPILMFDSFIYGTDPIERFVNSDRNSSSIYSVYLNPGITNYSDFEWFFTLYEPIDWFNKFYRGLTYTTEFEPVIVSPIPTFSPITTPTPVPTFLVPVTITPISLPVDPIINTAYGDPISYVMSMINMVGSVLSSNVVTFFSTVVSYIYNTSIFFEILMFVVPAIVLIAFVVGRLKRK